MKPTDFLEAEMDDGSISVSGYYHELRWTLAEKNFMYMEYMKKTRTES